jgi:hypothetical protein
MIVFEVGKKEDLCKESLTIRYTFAYFVVYVVLMDLFKFW